MPYSDCGQVHRFQEVALVLPLQEQTKWKLSKSVIDVWEAGSIAWIASHLMACSPELMVGPDEGSAICVWWDQLSFSGNIFHEEFVSRTLFNEHALVKGSSLNLPQTLEEKVSGLHEGTRSDSKTLIILWSQISFVHWFIHTCYILWFWWKYIFLL